MSRSIWDDPPLERGKRLKEAIVDAGLDEKRLVDMKVVSRRQLRTMLLGSFDRVRASTFQLMANQKIDVQYVLTGKRQQLSPAEEALLENYRNSKPERQKTLQEVGIAFAEHEVDRASGE